MTENSRNSTDELYIPLDEAEENQQKPDPATKTVINFNVNDAAIALVKDLYKDVDASKDMDEAKAAKKVLTKMRTTLAEAHKEQKAESLAYGRMLDAEKNRLLSLIGAVENPIKKQIDDIVNAAALAEDNRKGNIMGHMDRLASYALDRHDLDVEQIKERRANLAKEPLTEEIYEEFLAEAKMAHEEADTKLRIVLQRELDADIERDKQAKIAEENAARQKELDERQRKMDEEEIERNREAVDKANRKSLLHQKEVDERQAKLDAQEAKQEEERKRLDGIAEEVARIANEERKRLERIVEAEEAEQEQRTAEATKLRLAPDCDKLERLAQELSVWSLPQVESDEANAVLAKVVEKMAPIIQYINSEARKMK